MPQCEVAPAGFANCLLQEKFIQETIWCVVVDKKQVLVKKQTI